MWLSRLWRQRELNRELDPELEFHVAERISALRSTGMSEDELRRQVRLEFGGIEQVREACLEARGTLWVSSTIQDIHYGLRTLRKNPGFAFTAILTMTLGIGATTAIFSAVNAALLRQLPYKEPGRLVSISDTVQGMKNWPSTYPNFLDWERQSDVFEGIGAYQGDSFSVVHDTRVDHVRAWNVSAKFFQVLGVKPMLGRDFQADDDRPSAAPVVLLSHSTWQQWFNRNPEVLGKALVINGRPFMIVGVIPKNFRFYEDAGLYTPLGLGADEMKERSSHSIRVIGRLKPEITIEQARSRMIALAANLAKEYPTTNSGTSVDVVGLHEYLVQDTRPVLFVLLGAVGFLLLIASVNVANLLLARGASRAREMAMRVALGAKSSRLIRQLLTESAVVAIIAGCIAVLFCWATSGLLEKLIPEDRRALLSVVVDDRVLVGTLICCFVTAALFGLIPAIHASKLNVTETLRSGRTSTDQTHRKFREALMVAEVALALILLNGAGLMLSSIRDLLDVNTGFDPSHLLTMRVALSETAYATPAEQSAFAHKALQQISTVPGVDASSVAAWIPFQNEAWLDSIYIEGQTQQGTGQFPQIHYNVVSPDFFRTLGIPILQGRIFSENDNSEALRVAIVNRSMAQRYWPDADPVGKHFTEGRIPDGAHLLTVVGVVGNSKIDALDETDEPQFYIPFFQFPNAHLTFTVRTKLYPLALTSAVKKEVANADATQAPYDITSMREAISSSLDTRHLLMILLAAFAALSLVLAAVGIYGVTSYLASQRTQEIGIRMALGAARGSVLGLVLFRGLRQTAIGLAIGITGSLWLSRFLVAFLYGVRPTDPLVLAIGSAMILFVALLAAGIPAYSTTRINPVVALKCE
jgi:putative ABC transport system permease protein